MAVIELHKTARGYIAVLKNRAGLRTAAGRTRDETLGRLLYKQRGNLGVTIVEMDIEVPHTKR